MSFARDLHQILVATDGSPSAAEAIDFALEVAVEQDAELIFVHVVRTLDLVSGDPDDAGYALLHEPTERDRAVLEVAAALAANHGVTATTVLLGGSAAEEIVAYGESSNVDLIVVGTRGHSAVASVLLGSVSLGVLRKSTRPVLIVRGASTYATGNATRTPTP